MLDNLPKQDRPRERLIEYGTASLSDVELLAIIIGSGTMKADVFTIAKNLLNQYRIDELKDIDYERLVQIQGIKQAKACQLLACFELAKRSMRKLKTGKKWDTPKEIYDYVYADFCLEKKELIIVLFLNCKLELLKKLVFKGRDTFRVELSYKEIIKQAVNLDAYGIVLIHNHPSGDTSPSKADIEATSILFQLLSQLDILLLDHLIVSNQGFYSFEENGLFLDAREYTGLGDSCEEDNLSVIGSRCFRL